MTQTTEPMPGGAPAPRPPGRPRSARAEKAILDATLDLLAEEAGVAAVSMEAVASRAGVGKTTIYRRWPNKEALIVDALATIKHPLPELTGSSVRADLLALAGALGTEQQAKHTKCFWNVLGGAEKHPGLLARYRQDVIEPRREVMRGVLRRGMRTGELRPDLDPDAVITMLVGSMTLPGRGAAPPDSMGEHFAETVIDILLRGISG